MKITNELFKNLKSDYGKVLETIKIRNYMEVN